MADETKTARIVAYSYIYNGAAVTSTRLYFDDGTVLTVAGHVTFPVISTYKVTWTPGAGSKPCELKSLELQM